MNDLLRLDDKQYRELKANIDLEILGLINELKRCI